MSGLVILVPIAIAMGLLALATFLWSLRSGQYEDLDGASQRILADDDDGDARNSQGTAGPKSTARPSRAD